MNSEIAVSRSTGSIILPTLKRSFEQDLIQQFSTVARDELELHTYQEYATEWLLAHPFSNLFVDLGLGKSVIILTLIARLLETLDDYPILVIAPLRVAVQTWPTEKGLWSHTAHLSHSLIRAEQYIDEIRAEGRQRRLQSWYRGMDDLSARKPGAPKNYYWLNSDVQRAETAAAERIRARLANRRASFHVINREQVEWLVDYWGKKWPYKMVVVDESTSFADHKSDRFKALSRARKYIERMHHLTATPAADGYLKLFATTYLLDRGERFGRSITNFKETYFIENKYSHAIALKPGAAEQIAEKISDITLTMRAEDYLDLEKPNFIDRPVLLDPLEMERYKKFEKEYILELEDGTEIEAERASDLSNKLLQLASGSVYDAERKVHFVHDKKLLELQQLREEVQDKPLLVAYWFKPSLARLKKAFPDAVVMDKEGKAVDAWNAGKIKMLLVHPASAGHGLNMQHGGNYLVFFDIPWSLELYLQIIGRLARQGQKEVVLVYHLIAMGTIDEDVVAALQAKDDMQEILFGFLKQRFKQQMRKLRISGKFADLRELALAA